MKLTKSFFEETILLCKKEQERLRMDFERQEGVIRFCQKLITDGTFLLEGEKENPSGLVGEETLRG